MSAEGSSGSDGSTAMEGWNAYGRLDAYGRWVSFACLGWPAGGRDSVAGGEPRVAGLDVHVTGIAIDDLHRSLPGSTLRLPSPIGLDWDDS